MKKIIELMIDWENLEFEDLGVDVMSIVDKPAIGVNFLKFAHQEFVEPESGESEDDFVGRCIPVLIEEGYDTEQATAICYSSYIDEDFRENPECPDGFEHRMPDGTYMCGKEHGYDEVLRQEEMEAAIITLAKEYGDTVDYEKAVYIDGTQTKFEGVGDYLKGIVGLDILGKQDLEKKPETKYRYAGPLSSNTRNFCRAMVRLNKIYSREEISSMDSSINTGFRHNGQAYSIFDFKGGVNCNHYWEELEVYKEGRDTVILSKGRASGDAGRVASSSNNYWRYPGTFNQFAFTSDDEMVVVGPAMIPDQLILRKDELGKPFHVFFSKETVAKIAQKFFEYNKQNNTDINHDDDITTNNTLLESWIVDDPKMDKSTSLGFNVPKGTWMTSYKINDMETWQKIKNGDLNGYSIAGNFIEKASKI